MDTFLFKCMSAKVLNMKKIELIFPKISRKNTCALQVFPVNGVMHISCNFCKISS